jgi:hypothetical protein
MNGDYFMKKLISYLIGLSKLSGLQTTPAKMLIFMVFALASCTPAAAPKQQPTVAPTQPAATATKAPTATALPPTATATQAPTSTTAPTATPLPPTATAVPPLAVLPDGFNLWCAPLEYEGTRPTGPDAPDYARKMTNEADQIQVTIPATYCVISYTFNRAAPAGMTLEFIDANTPFLKLSLAADSGKPEVAWTAVTHRYVVNPPLWWVQYKMVLKAADGKELWSNAVKFAKVLPETCLFGGLPDPVTLWCTKTDPYEIENRPGVVYPWDRDRLKTPHPAPGK